MSTPDAPDAPDDGTTDVRGLLGAYAVDAVDDTERRRVEKLLASDPEAAREVATLRATAAALGAAAAAAPPPELRSAVLSRLAETRQVGTAVPAPAPAPARSRWSSRRTTWLAVAAAVVLGASVPSGVAWHQAREIHRIQAQSQAVAQLLADPLAEVRRVDVPGGGTVVGVLARDRALFTATGLPQPGPGRVYQLWVVRDGVPQPDAVMAAGSPIVRATPDQYVVLTHDYAAGDSLAVTVEPTGGSLKPTTSPIVVVSPV